MWLEVDTRMGRSIPSKSADLIGKTYYDTSGREITVIGTDPLNPANSVLLESEDGKQWGCSVYAVRKAVEEYERLCERLYRQMAA